MAYGTLSWATARKSKGSAHFSSAPWRGTLPLTGCVTLGRLHNLPASVSPLKTSVVPELWALTDQGWNPTGPLVAVGLWANHCPLPPVSHLPSGEMDKPHLPSYPEA